MVDLVQIIKIKQLEAEIKIPGCYWGKSFGKRYLVISIFFNKTCIYP